MRTFIITEGGVNHNGNLNIAFKLIDIAKKAGADAVKFQTFKAEKVATTEASKTKYQIENTGIDESQFEMLQRLELTFEMHKEIISYCKEKDIIFMSTPFDEDSADMLDNLGMTIFKIPSGEITNKPFLQHVAKKGKPIILSTGMSYLGEVEKAIIWINHIWDEMGIKPQLALLHCVSNYPASVEDINLSAMKAMEKAFGLPVGYSDHTMAIEISVSAVALGASVIETHFTLNRHMKGPDHKASFEPDELCTLVKAIRNVEKAIGDGRKRPTPKEEEIRINVRRSLVAARDIKKGEVIDRKSIAVKRPGYGIVPELLECVVNKMAQNDIKKDSVLSWSDF